MLPNPQRHTLVSAVHLFLIRDDQILLLRRFQTGYQDGNYSVAAGHIDAGESATHAMIREAHEELGILVQPDALEFAHVMHRHSDRDAVDFFFWCRAWTGTPTIAEPDKCDEILWVKMSALPENTIPYIQFAVHAALNDQKYSTYGWDSQTP